MIGNSIGDGRRKRCKMDDVNKMKDDEDYDVRLAVRVFRSDDEGVVVVVSKIVNGREVKRRSEYVKWGELVPLNAVPHFTRMS
jgi:hypothetical protein